MDEPKTVSLIAIHAHGIPTEFPREAILEAEGAKPVAAAGRTDLRKIPLITIDPEDARDHDDAVWAGPDPDASNKGGHIVIVAIADVAHYVRPGSDLDREKRRSAAIPFISPIASCRCCPKPCPPTFARCAKTKNAPALPFAWCSTQAV